MTRLRPGIAHALYVRIGGWFEARASGWAVIMVPLVLLVLIGAALTTSGT